MQQFADYIALIAFAVVYFISRDIFIATGVLMVGVTLQVGLYWVMKKPITTELKVTFWASMILGGMTLLLRDETFIQWKPTLVNWALACALIGGHLFGKTFFLEKMLGKALRLPNEAWLTLTYSWAAAFAGVGVLNLWVAQNFSMDTWVTFKLVGLIGLNVVFMAIMFAYLYFKGWLSEEHLLDPKDQDTLTNDAISNDKLNEALEESRNP